MPADPDPAPRLNPAPTGRLDFALATGFAGWLAEHGVQHITLSIDSEPPQPLAARHTDLPAILLRASTATRATIATSAGTFQISQGRLHGKV